MPASLPYTITPARLVALLILICLSRVDASSNGGVIYQHPVPGALFVSPMTNIVLRFDTSFPSGDRSQLPAITLSGTTSGEHSSQLSVSDDEKTLIVKPDRPFSSGERVSVVWYAAFEGNPIRHQFSFTVGGVPQASISLEMERGEEILNRGSDAQSPYGYRPARTVEADTLPLDFPYVQTLTADTNELGRIFLSNLSFTGSVVPYLMILDNLGRPLFYRKMDAVCTDFKVQPNGQLTYFDTGSKKFFAMDSQYTVIDSFTTGNGYTADIHEFRILPDGHAILLSYDPQVVDMSAIVAGGKPAATVTGLIIQELDLQKQVVFEWRSWDHFLITDATHENLTAANIDYVHGNALELDNDGTILLSSRHMDEVTKISRQTGNIIWRMGGKHNEFSFVNDSVGYSHQHAIRRLANGHLLLFDNGNFHSPQFSRALEYAVDESLKSASLVWQYRHSPSDLYGMAMGYAQRLDNGNTLIGWGAANPSVTEVRPDGSTVFEMTLATDIYSYRAFRFPWKDAVAAPPPGPPESSVLYQNYPNPFNSGTKILITLAKEATVTFQVYDVLGRLLLTTLDHQRTLPGTYYLNFDGSRLASGIYFYQLITDQVRTVRKMQLMK